MIRDFSDFDDSYEEYIRTCTDLELLEEELVFFTVYYDTQRYDGPDDFYTNTLRSCHIISLLRKRITELRE